MESSNKLTNDPRKIQVDSGKKSLLTKFKDFYNDKYLILLLIPFLLLVFSFITIGLKYASTGDFINRDVSLKGGVTLTITTDESINIKDLISSLESAFPENGIDVRSLTQFGRQAGIIIVIDFNEDEIDEKLGILQDKVQEITGITLNEDNFSVEIVGSSLGASFFREVIRALLVAFLFMGAVVFLYFGPDLKFKVITFSIALFASLLLFFNKGIITDLVAFIIGAALIYIFIKWSIPSFAVILAAFSDIVVTLAIVNLLGINLSTAGIAAFLMLIGYSVDTNILLSTRVLKRKQGAIIERIYGAAKTGLTMTATTVIALSVAMIFTQSEIIKQIMLILLIGLFVDLINTWIQNAGILRFYIKNKQKIK